MPKPNTGTIPCSFKAWWLFIFYVDRAIIGSGKSSSSARRQAIGWINCQLFLPKIQFEIENGFYSRKRIWSCGRPLSVRQHAKINIFLAWSPFKLCGLLIKLIISMESVPYRNMDVVFWTKLMQIIMIADNITKIGTLLSQPLSYFDLNATIICCRAYIRRCEWMIFTVARNMIKSHISVLKWNKISTNFGIKEPIILIKISPILISLLTTNDAATDCEQHRRVITFLVSIHIVFRLYIWFHFQTQLPY